MRRGEGQLGAALDAAFGFGRAAAGGIWLRAFIRRNRRLEPPRLFASAWSAARRWGFLFAGAERYDNCYGHPWRDILFLRILHHLNGAGVPFTPQVTVSGSDLLPSGTRHNRPTIVVVMHSPVDAVLNRLFAEAAVPASLLAAGVAGPSRKAKLLGFQGDLDIVPRNDDALLLMRRKLAEGRLISACVDFTRRMGRSFRRDVFVSPVMFDLALRTKASILYASTRVSDEGVVEVALAAPRIDVARSTADACAEDFISWLIATQGDRRDLRVLRWSQKLRHERGLLALPKIVVRSSPLSR